MAAGLPEAQGDMGQLLGAMVQLLGEPANEDGTPPWLWRLLGNVLAKGEGTRAPGPGMAPETAMQLPPIMALPPAIPKPPTYAGIDLAAVLASPLFTDTLEKAFGPVPRAEKDPYPHPEGAGYVLPPSYSGGSPHSEPVIRINQTNWTQDLPIDVLMAHEYTHAREMNQDPGILAVREAMAEEYKKLAAMDTFPDYINGRRNTMGEPGTIGFRVKNAQNGPGQHIAVSVEQALELMRNKATPKQVDEADRQLPGTRVIYDHIQRSINPEAQDATQVKPSKADFSNVRSGSSSQPAGHSISATPDQGWFRDIVKQGAQWMQEHDVKSLNETPVMKLLTAVMGENPLEAIEGPGKAIASFAARAPRAMKMISDPHFAKWMHDTKALPIRGGRTFSPAGIEKLFQKFIRERDRLASLPSRPRGDIFEDALPFQRK